MVDLKRPHCFIAWLLVCAATVAWGNGRDHLDGFLRDFKTLTAKFEQTLVSEQGQQLEASRGQVYLQRPGRFRWDYFAPHQQSIIADGERVWVYDKDLEQVSVKPFDSAVAETPALLLSGRTDLDREFEVSELGKADGLEWIRLKPRKEQAQYALIRLGFDGPRVKVMELLDNFGQTTRIVFSGERRNGRIDPALFKFVPPPGVDVLDAADAGE
ncbi:MAG: outer membrane lipoprotein chaperone LolA [Gammaproteobacteria bacterium]